MLNILRNKLRTFIRVPLLYLDWYIIRYRIFFSPSIFKVKGTQINSYLLVSPDPNYLVGSKGDEAMILAIATSIYKIQPNAKVAILTNLSVLPNSLLDVKVDCEPRWSNPWSIKDLVSIINNYSTLITIGADVVDGKYSPISALRMWILADLAARMGKASIVTGFSFNKSASRLLSPILKNISNKVNIYSRDEFSLYRFNQKSINTAKLVADTAFMLEPYRGVVFDEAYGWVGKQKDKGRIVVGINIHPMLFANVDDQKLESIASVVIKVLKQLFHKQNVAFMLISHDYRAKFIGDNHVLSLIFDGLKDMHADKVFFCKRETTAAELKAVVSLLDLVATGRMHLAIASLGVNVPIGVLTYQDKFEGLLKHFHMPDYCSLNPDLFNDQNLEAWLLNLIEKKDDLQEIVDKSISNVLKRSGKNLEIIA